MKQKITFSVIAMAVSLTGIIILQLYWINGAINVRGKQFDSQVLDAMNDATGRLQLHEAMTVLPKILPGLDSVQRKSVDSFFEKRAQHHHRSFGVHRNRKPGNLTDNPFKPQKEVTKEHDQQQKNGNAISSVETPEKIIEQSRINDSMMADSGKRLMAKANIYNRALRRMMSDYIIANKDIHSRVSKHFLDSLLESEFHQRGIDIPYKSAILNRKDNSFDFISSKADTGLLRNTIYKAALFPDDLQPLPYSLAVYFPGKQGFVLRSIGLILPGSFLFMLIII